MTNNFKCEEGVSIYRSWEGEKHRVSDASGSLNLHPWSFPIIMCSISTLRSIQWHVSANKNAPIRHPSNPNVSDVAGVSRSSINLYGVNDWGAGLFMGGRCTVKERVIYIFLL